MKSLKFIYSSSIVMTIMLLLVGLPVSTAMAYTEGPYDTESGTNGIGIGTEPWQNPENITTPGSPYTTVTLYQGHRYSNYLQGTQYGFAIPAEANITGIEVNINRMSSSRNPNVIDNVISLVKAGATVGDNKASAVQWPTTLTIATYGSPTDLWGTTWTPTDINSPDFGVAMAAYRDNNGNNSRDALIDTLQIMVYYEFTTTTTVECGDGAPIMYGDSIICVATVTRLNGDTSPNGTVSWNTDGNGLFNPNSCTLSGADGVSTCSVTYTPNDVGIGSHLITTTYNGDEYYTPSSAIQIVTETPRPLTVTADPQSKVFGNDDPAFTYNVTSGSLVFSDTFSGTLNRDPGEDVGQYKILQHNLTLSANYDLTYVDDYLTITKADPTCEITAYIVEYDREAHTATGACTGVKGKNLTGLDLTGTTHIEIGTYTDDPWTFTDVTGNYNNAAGTVDDEITLRAITIVADKKSKSIKHSDPVLTFQITIGSLLAGDSFNGELTRQPGESIGKYAILQGALSLSDYYNVTYVGADFTITGIRCLLPVIFKYP